MKTKLVKWGNGQGIRITRGIMEEARMDVNELLDVSVKDGRIVIEKAFKHRTLEERAAEYGGMLGPYEEFNWGEPVGEKLW